MQHKGADIGEDVLIINFLFADTTVKFTLILSLSYVSATIILSFNVPNSEPKFYDIEIVVLNIFNVPILF